MEVESRSHKNYGSTVYPPAEKLLDLFVYDEVKGVLIWKVDRGRNKMKGKVAGSTKSSDHYTRVRIPGVFSAVKVNAVIWAMKTGEWPDFHIRHINGDRNDTRWENFELTNKAWPRGYKYKEYNNAGILINFDEVKK